VQAATVAAKQVADEAAKLADSNMALADFDPLLGLATRQQDAVMVKMAIIAPAVELATWTALTNAIKQKRRRRYAPTGRHIIQLGTKKRGGGLADKFCYGSHLRSHHGAVAVGTGQLLEEGAELAFAPLDRGQFGIDHGIFVAIDHGLICGQFGCRQTPSKRMQLGLDLFVMSHANCICHCARCAIAHFSLTITGEKRPFEYMIRRVILRWSYYRALSKMG
jgi:hypothetical protein